MNPLTDTLQSCPFCGAHAFLVGGVTEFEVKCCNSECGARGLPHSIKSHAIAAWNRRAEVEAARAALEVKTGQTDENEVNEKLRALGWYQAHCRVCGESWGALYEPERAALPEGDEMKLMRNTTPNGQCKYAAVRMDKVAMLPLFDDQERADKIRAALQTLADADLLENPKPGEREEFFLIKLKDRNAQAALYAYEASIYYRDKEFAAEVHELAARAGERSPFCKDPD